MSRAFKNAGIWCALLLAGLGGHARAQAAGTVEGIARIAGSNEPMAFALVRVLGADSATLASEITNAEGHFRFANVTARDVRLRILRIGFRPTTSPVLHLEASIPRANGALGVSFHPKRARPAGYAIRGTIWLNAATYAIQRIDYEHLDDGQAFSQTNIDYTPVRVGESSLSLPSGGRVTLHPRGPGHFLASEVTATLLYSYSDFEEMPPR